MRNFGWPCYEGDGRQGAYDNAQPQPLRDALRAGRRRRRDAVLHLPPRARRSVPGETCPTGGSSISGLAFYPAGGSFPAAYDGALFFADYTRNCIWVDAAAAPTACPTRRTRQTFVAGAAEPGRPDQIGPDGDLYYVDLDGGTIRRIRVARRQPRRRSRVATATPTTGAVPLTVELRRRGLERPRRRQRSPTPGTSTATARSTTRPSADAELHLHDRRHRTPCACASPTPAASTDTVDVRSSPAGRRSRSATITTPGRRARPGRSATRSPSPARRPTSAATPIAGERPDLGAQPAALRPRSGDLPHAHDPELRRRRERLVRRARPRVPVVPRARADGDRRRRPDRARSRAGSTRRRSRSRCEPARRACSLTLGSETAGRAVHARGDPGLDQRHRRQTPQTIGGPRYAFASWSDGGARNAHARCADDGHDLHRDVRARRRALQARAAPT